MLKKEKEKKRMIEKKKKKKIGKSGVWNIDLDTGVIRAM